MRKQAFAGEWLRRAYVVGMILAAGARMAAIWDTDPERVYSRWSTATDAGVYDRFGWNVAREGTLGVGDRPSAFSLPAYPLLIGSIYRLAGHRPGAVRWAQVILGLATVFFLGRLAFYLGGEEAEVLAVFVAALHPYFLYFTRELLTETIFLFAFSGMMLTAVQVGQLGRRRDGIRHGAFAALGLMARPVGLVLEAGVLLLCRPWARQERRSRLTGLLAGALVFALTWGAWVVRNRQVFGEFVPLDTHGGFALYFGQLYSRGFSADEIRRRVGYSHIDIEQGRLPNGPRGEFEADRRAGEAAGRMIREDPVSFLRTFPRNMTALWFGMDFGDVAAQGGRLGLLVLVGVASYLPLLLMGLGGLVRMVRLRNWGFLGGITGILLLTTAVHAVVLGGKRYRVATIDPVLIVLAAYQASGWIRAAWRRVRRMRIRSWAGDGDEAALQEEG